MDVLDGYDFGLWFRHCGHCALKTIDVDTSCMGSLINMAFMKFEDFHENWFIYDLMFEKELYTMVFSTFNQWTSWT